MISNTFPDWRAARHGLATENAPVADRPWQTPIVRPALQEEAAKRIKQMIEDGALLPGDRIPERQLCEQLGISRTPLREAFRALAAEGLIEAQPRRGAVVKKLKPADIDHMFQVLEALEALAGELACERISEDELAKLAELHNKMMLRFRRHDRRGFFRLNQEIHEKMVIAAGNPVLAKVYEGLSGQIRRVRYIAGSSDEQWATAAQEHEEIMKALKARDKRALSSILRVHLKNKRERVKSFLAE